MYITPRQKKRYVLTAVLSAISIPLTVLAGYLAVSFFASAGGDETPSNIVIANLTTRSATITWTTTADAIGEVSVVDGSGTESTIFSDTRGSSARQTHFVEVTDLEPASEYSIKIYSNGNVYTTAGGQDLKFSTFSVGSSIPSPLSVYGSIDGSVGDDSLLFISSKDYDVFPIVTIPSSTGNWSSDLSAMIGSNGAPIDFNDNSNLIILVQTAGGKGVIQPGTKAQLFDSSGKLNSGVPLTLTENTSIYAEIPGIAKPGSVSGPSNPVPNEPENPIVNNPTPNQPPDNGGDDDGDSNGNGDPTNPSEPTTPQSNFDPADREFLLKNDVLWVDLVSATTSTPTAPATPNIPFGEETLQVVNHTDTSFGLIWISEEKEIGSVFYGETAETLTDEAGDVRDGLGAAGEYYSHYVEITDLVPETTYYYYVSSGTNEIDNAGAPFEITTFESIDPPPFETLSGSIQNYSELEDAVIYATLADGDSAGTSGESQTIAVVPDSSGSWILSIGDARNQDGTDYFQFSDQDEINIALLTFAESEVVTDTLEDTDTKSIELTYSSQNTGTNGGGGSIQYQRIALLDDYGVSGTVPLASQSSSSSTNNQSTGVTTNYSGTITPKTSLSKPLAYALGLSAVSLISAIIIWILTKYRFFKKSNSKMVESI